MTQINKKMLRGFLTVAVVLMVFSSSVCASEYHTTHFYVIYDKSEFRYEDVREILGTLGRVHYKIAPALGFTPTSETEVILYSSPEKFRSVLGRPEWCGGAYNGKIHVPLMPGMKSVKELEPILRHEYTHAILHLQTKGNCPLWLHEGLAQYFEGVYEDKEWDDLRKSVVAKSPPSIGYGGLEFLFKSGDKILIMLAYMGSYTVVEYIIDRFGLGGIRALLDELAVGRSIDWAFTDGLGISTYKFEKDYLNSVGVTQKEKLRPGREFNQAELLYSLAQNYEVNKRYDLAIEQYQKVIESYPDSSYAKSAEQRIKELKTK